ncbi:MFS transporter [Nocardioides terrisoli]|uniref:MFS transporter n=1 Tax=Nocardioides terrisoli TaxID=3388267 RepID=UPI00287BB6AD|nr:MFS transporter [Nocardioides marmorisolisilvae]
MTDTSTTATSSRPGHGHTHLGWALVLITMAQLMVVLDSTIANIALPNIGRDLHITEANLQWIVTGYALAFGGLLLLGGRLGDLFGRRRIFTIGLVIFVVASFAGGFAQDEIMLIGSRGLQGLGAALASPAALALITTTFPAGPPRNRAFSVYAAMSGVGAAVGLLLGGWLTGSNPHLGSWAVEGWRLTFFINVPLGLVAAFFAKRVLAESEPHPGELDLPGAVTGTAGLMALVYGITRAGDHRYGWSNDWTLVALAAGVLLLALFIFVESRVEHPLVPFRIFQSRTRATAFIAMMMVPAAMFAMFFFLSLFVQNVMGYSPMRTGLAFVPFSFGMVFSATVASKLINRIDPRFIAGVGTILAGTALFAFSRLSVDQSAGHVARVIASGGHLGDSVNYWTQVFPFIILMAVGMGATFVPMTLSAVHGVGARDSGIGSGVLNTMQQVGGALGLATLSTVAVHFNQSAADQLFPKLRALIPVGPHTDDRSLHLVSQVATFTEGAGHAFLTGAFMIWAASAIVWIFLNARHEELATEDIDTIVVGDVAGPADSGEDSGTVAEPALV